MKHNYSVYSTATLLAAVFFTVLFSGSVRAQTRAARPALYEWTPPSSVVFWENKGQVRSPSGEARPEIRYRARINGADVYFASGRVSYVWRETPGARGAETSRSPYESTAGTANAAPSEGAAAPGRVYRLDMEIVGANPNARVGAKRMADDRQNYYFGETAVEGVRGWRVVMYEDVYPGIDLAFYGKDGQLKYDFVVHPGADPAQIRLRYNGAERVRVGADGAARAVTPAGSLIENAPRAWQELRPNWARVSAEQTSPLSPPKIGAATFGESPRLAYTAEAEASNGPRDVSVAFRAEGNELFFDVADYDPNRLLVIDPVVDWSTYYGGGDADEINGVATDDAGNVYFCGETASSNFPETVGSSLQGTRDAFAAMFDNAGVRQWATYFGGGQDDGATGIDVGPDALPVAAGYTLSGDFPASGGAFQPAPGGGSDACLFKFDPAGARVWASYYGGGQADYSNLAPPDVAVDSNNEVVLAGASQSAALPGLSPASDQQNSNGASEGFLAKIAADGSAVEWATFLGGSDDDFAFAVAVSDNNEIAVGGGTSSGDFAPTFGLPNPYVNFLNGGSDAFAVKYDANGKRLWGTYYGGSDNEMDNGFGGIAFSPNGDVILAGRTNSADIPSTSGGPQNANAGGTDGFIVRFSGAGSTGSRLWSSYLGGSSDDGVRDVICDDAGNVIVAGQTFSDDFPTAGAPFQNALGAGGGADGFLTIISADGSAIDYSTYLGGNSTVSENDDARALAVTRSGEIFVGGRSAASTDFLGPTGPVFPKTGNNLGDGFLVKFDDNNITSACTGFSDGAPIEMLTFTLGVDLVYEYPNTMAAVERHIKNYNLTEAATEAAFLVALAANPDVVIMPEVEDPAVNLGVFSNIATDLQNYINGGGTVIFLGSGDAFAPAIFNTGVFTGGSNAWLDTFEEPVFTDIANKTTPLTNNVRDFFDNAITSSIYNIQDPAFVSVLEMGTTYAGWKPMGAGKAILIGNDFETYTNNTAQILGNAVAWAGDNPDNGIRYAVSYETTNATCDGPGNDGAIDLRVTNAGPLVTYAWSNGATTQDLADLTPGIYTVTVTGGSTNACEEILAIDVEQCAPCEPADTLSVELTADVPAQCAPASPVTITSDVKGGCGDYDVASIPYNPIPVPGNAISIPLLDETTIGPFPIGFDFSHFCENQKFFYISDNGFVTFSEDQNYFPWLVQNLPDRNVPNNLIAFAWADYAPDPGTEYRYFMTGAAPNRALVIDVQAAPHRFGGGGPLSAQLILHEGDSIEVHIASMTTDNTDHTIGLENRDGTKGVAAPGRNADPNWSATNESWRFIPKSDPADLTYEWVTVADPNTVLGTAKDLTHTPTDTTEYVLNVGHRLRNCASADTIEVQVDEPPQPGAVASDQTVCEAGNTGTLTLSGHTGTVVRWESSTDGFLSVLPSANTTTSETYNNLTQTTQYRAVLENGLCPEVESAPATVTVDPVSVGGALSGGGPVCSGDPSPQLTLAGQTGAVIRWEFSNNCPTFTNPQNIAHTQTTYTSGPLTQNTCFRAVVQSGTCPEAVSSVAEVPVLNASIGGTLAGGTAICQGDAGPTLTLAGQIGGVLRWESSTDCPAFTNPQIINNTTTSLNTGTPNQTTCYRAVVQSGGCAEANSTIETVDVGPATQPGSVTGGGAVCEGSASGNLTLSGHNGNVVRWESSTDCPAFTNPQNIAHTQTTYNSGALTQETCFRAVVQSGGCAEQPSVATTVTITPATVGGAVDADQTICSGDVPAALSLSGETGNVVRWESSTDCPGFTNPQNIAHTQVNYTPAALSQTTCFRAVVQNTLDCAEENSAISTIAVSPAATGGAVTGAQTICPGGLPTTLTLSGHTGTVARWESSTDCQNFTNPQTIAHTQVNYTPSAPTQTTCYRAVVGGGACGTAESAWAEITVSGPAAGGTLNADRTVCAGAFATPLILSGFTGMISRWESSTDCPGFGGAVTQIPNNQPVYIVPPLTQTTCFRAVVQNGACPETNSTVATYTVSPGSVGGITGGDTEVCAGESANLTLNGQSGDVVAWESSADCVNFTNPVNRGGAGQINYTTTPLFTPQCFRARVRDGSCAEAFSTIHQINVLPAANPGQLIGGNETVCQGGSAKTLLLTQFTGNIVRWESSTDCQNFSNPTDLGNAGRLDYKPFNIQQTTCYRAVVQDGACPEVFSNAVRVDVSDLTATLTTKDVASCGDSGELQAQASGGQGGFYLYMIDPPIAPVNVNGLFLNLKPGQYDLTVYDLTGGCRYTTPFEIKNLLPVPQIQQITNIANTSATVIWDNPAPAPPVATYELRYRVKGATAWKSMPLINAPFFGMTSLSSGTEYEVQVRYNCASGISSDWSATETFETAPGGNCTTQPYSVPGGLFVKNVTAHTATIKWTNVPNAAGYVVAMGLAAVNPRTWPTFVVCAPQDSFVFTGLTPGTDYAVRVRTSCAQCTTKELRGTMSEFTDDVPFKTPIFRVLGGETGNSGLSIYPNPNRGAFSARFTAAGRAVLTLHDLAGREVWRNETEAPASAQEIVVNADARGLAPGVYLLQLETAEGRRQAKVAIE